MRIATRHGRDERTTDWGEFDRVGKRRRSPLFRYLVFTVLASAIGVLIVVIAR